MSEKITLRPMNIGLATGAGQGYGMSSLLQNEQFQWSVLEEFEWIQAMKECPQEPAFHAEGDVYVHTQMVVNELQKLKEFQVLDEEARLILLFAALLHDVAKPNCTVVENGIIISPKHAKVGEKIARQLLWDSDFEVREKICALVRLHGLPLWSLDKNFPNKSVIASSLRVPNEWIYILSKADVLGRICNDQADLLYRLELFKELCLENNCFTEAKTFVNAHSRVQYFLSDSDYVADLFDETQFEVILMVGIAGSGKDTYIERYGKGLPIISLDAIRQELGIKFTDKDGQGKVVQHAYDVAKEYCRKKQPFIWNSTNLSLRVREKLIRTLLVYKPKIKLVYIETSLANIYARRKTQIKAKSMTSMLRVLDMPQLTEVHEIEVVIS